MFDDEQFQSVLHTHTAIFGNSEAYVVNSGCLIAMNGDTRKEPIAFAQSYSATKARKL